MTETGVAVEQRVESKAFTLRVWSRRYETQVTPVVHIVAAPEYRRTVLRLFQEVAERGDGTVVQVWRAQPDPIERHRGIAISLAKMVELPGSALAKCVHLVG